MQQQQKSQAFIRKRKMMLVMPLIVLPFITLAFWALGGGKGTESGNNIVSKQGLNLNLPDANLKDDGIMDKLSFYDKAAKDSSQLEEWMRNDPYYKLRQDSLNYLHNGLEQITQSAASKYNQKLNFSPYENNNNNPEQKIMDKVALLEKELNKQTAESNKETENNSPNTNETEFAGHVDKLQEMMTGMTTDNSEDPEIKQLGNTLDKILDIQHPERVRDRIKEKSLQQKETVFAVAKFLPSASISLLDTGKRKANNNSGFYGLNDEKEIEAEDNAIEAVVPENIILVNGSVTKLRLLNDIYINGVLVPRNTIVSGTVALDNERLQVAINSIRYNNSLFPVKLEVYDLDGLAGIYIPGAITRDVAKQSADNSLQLMELTSLDPSLKAQAAAAGVNTVKNLLSKKVKQVKIMVKAGYRVLLRDKNIQQ
ncbi:MAG: conjugative transposon protein TraM [Sphingobacteriia bacterium]|nr:conjugative transposon protein TraM [Sphingobacteriia bacterium]